MLTKRAWLLVPCAFALGCEQGQIGANPAGPPAQPVPWTPPPGSPDPVDVTINPGDHGELYPKPPTPEEAFRQRRRLDVDQLDQSIRTVTGGIGWVEVRNNVEVNLFVELGPTLGKPDYIAATDEDLDPSAMFQKFLDDAARSVCTELIDVDPTRAPEARTFFTAAEPTTRYAAEPAKAEENLRQLLLRFHGHQLAAGAPELAPWIWLMRSAEHVTTDQAQVWRLVCVGLFTHPDFYTY